MKNLLSKKFSILVCGVVATTPFTFTSLTSCSASHAIQFANFESYMDSDLMDHLQEQYDTQFQWYTVTEMIETKFHRTYDIAAPSGYELSVLQKKGWLQEIDWEKFGIEGVKTVDDAKQLFAEPIQEAIDRMSSELGVNPLKYGVPYFAQSFSFIYKGEQEVTFYKNGTSETISEPNWADIFYTIGPKNQHLDERFTNRIGMVDDSKSIYDVSRIIQTIKQYPNDSSKWTNVIPEGDTIPQLKETFKALTDLAQSDWYSLNTDSGIISRNLADHSEYGYVAALSWSGDALYASQGAGEFDPYSGKEMHVVKPKGASLDEIEFLVINNKNDGETERLDRIYSILKDVCLDGALAQSTKDDIGSKQGDRFKYWSMQNWDTVSYTPTLKSIYDYVVNIDSDYWDDYCDKTDTATRTLYTTILQMTNQQYAKSLFGKPLSAEQNSDTHWAWLESRGNL